MSDGLTVVDAGVLLTPTERISRGRIVFRNGVIESFGKASDTLAPEGAHRIDAGEMTVTPGFIDPHVHGAGGADLMDGEFGSLNTVSRTLARHGTTSFLPTTISCLPEILGPTIGRIAALLGRKFQGAKPVGIHLEGPFINRLRRGAHCGDFIVPPDTGLLSEWIRQGGNHVKLLTFAPELEGTDAIISVAAAAGVTLAMGHSDASAAQAQVAAGRGVCYATHTFNAMRPIAHRDPGIAGAVLADDRIFAEIIVDGIHVAPELVRIFARAKGRDRILLVTDATSATDMPDGHYGLGQKTVRLSGGACRDTEGTLAGSALTQDAALKNLIRWTGMPLQDALFGLTLNPARALGLNGAGTIAAGAQADLVALDGELNVVRTFVGGTTVYERRG